MIKNIEIVDYPGYYFSYDPDNPEVPIIFYTKWKQINGKYSVLTEETQAEVKQHLCQGYYRIHLRNKFRERKIKSVHFIVASCLIENPFNLDTVDHINNDKNNNHPSNLQWLSKSYNSKKNAFTNEKSAAKAREYEIIFADGTIKYIFGLKDFARENNNFYNAKCLSQMAQKKNHSHKDIISVTEISIRTS
jgi:hypothetical protein